MKLSRPNFLGIKSHNHLILCYFSGFFVTLFLCILVFQQGYSQIVIGTGSSTNSPYSYPAPYGNWYHGARHQILVTASELTAAGMATGYISELAFDVAIPAGTPLVNFTIGMKLTSATSLSSFDNSFTTVFSSAVYTDVTGWNTHTFISQFYWDGISNILIETCFNNSSYTTNAQMYSTPTFFNSVVYYRADLSNVCTSTPPTFSTARPNMRFSWMSVATPPITNFAANTTFSCSGNIDFTDLSTNFPTSWQWDMGDGSPIDTNQNPTHFYPLDGTYNVTLITCNPYGCDTLILNSYVTVNTSAPGPIPSCTPATTSYCCGFGITTVMFNSINNTTPDGSEGYGNYTCTQTTVYEGQNYPISITTDNPANHNVRVWLDFNNDGVLADPGELVFSADATLLSTGTVSIPINPVLNTPLRMRISADYDLVSIPTPCSDLTYGQAEDYTVIIVANPYPPSVTFIANDTLTCSGTVCFTDLSQNGPTGWTWDFGDGSPVSHLYNPCHTYSSDGTYSVQLIASNGIGSDTATYSNYVTVNLSGQLTPASCTPNTLSYCCDYGIYNVELNTLTNPSGSGSEGYQDFSCSAFTDITEGSSYTITVRTGPSAPQDTKVWLDMNNDGVFNEVTELIFEQYNAYDPSGTILIPTGAAILNTPLRMRVCSDLVGSTITSCYTPQWGQVEDYAVTVVPYTNPPIANFSITTPNVCDSTYCFNDLSLSATSWSWNFGDGSPVDTNQNPCHVFPIGSFNITLTATNIYGNSNSNNLVTYSGLIGCDTVLIPTTGTDVSFLCSGVLLDDGGNSDYSNFVDGSVTISPSGATSVTMTFSSFNVFNGFPGDSIIVYDGLDIFSPIIGGFTGTTLPPAVTSTGSSLTVREITDGSNTLSGFAASWSCSTGITENNLNTMLTVHPNPASTDFTITYLNPISEDITISIHNLMGQLVYKKSYSNIGNFSTNINANPYDPGIYLILVETPSSSITQRMIIR